MAQSADKILSKVLVDNGIVTLKKIEALAAEIKKTGDPFSVVLLRSGLIGEEGLMNILAEELKLSCIDLKNTGIEKSVVEKVPMSFATYYNFMPVKIEKRVMTIAVMNWVRVSDRPACLRMIW